MSRFTLWTALLIDFIYITAIWIFDLDVYLVLSILIAETLWGFGIYCAIPIIKSNTINWIIKIVAAPLVLGLFLSMLVVFHAFIPPGYEYGEFLFDVLPTKSYWVSISYISITTFLLFKFIYSSVYENSEKNILHIRLTRILYMFYRMILFGFVFAFLIGFFETKDGSVVASSIPLYLKTAASILVILFALLDLGLDKKIRRLTSRTD